MTGPVALTDVLNALFVLGLVDAEQARAWLRAGGWQQLDAWIADHRAYHDPASTGKRGNPGRTSP